MIRAFSVAQKLRERFQRVWHFLVGPTAQQIDEAHKVLSGREYYHLYEDRYREASRAGGQDNSLIAQSQRLVWREFEQIRGDGLLPAPGANLIDLGCGDGHNAFHFAELGFRVTGVDVSSTAIGMATRVASEKELKINFRVADALELAEFADNSFDLATDVGCLHMLVREEHRRRYLKSVRRVLRSGGAFFLFNRVAVRDIKVSDEEVRILRSVSLVEKRWTDHESTASKIRGAGFRNASLRQYRQELEAAGFAVVHGRHIWVRYRPFWMVLLVRAS